MTARAVVLFLFIASNAAAQTGSGMQVSGQNSVADKLVERGVVLGLNFDRDNPKAPHPTRDQMRAAFEAGFGAWLSGELERADDTISQPPAAMRDYLLDRREAIWNVIAILEKGAPVWGERPDDPLWPNQTLLPTFSLERILIATALDEERNGREIEASRALEASWSLGRSVSSGKFLFNQLVSLTIEKLQAGALRKIQEPAIPWMSRLSGDEPWMRMLDATNEESAPTSALGADGLTTALRHVRRAVADRFRKLSACDASSQTDEEVWRAVAGEVEMDPNPGVRASAEPPPGPEAEPGDESAEGRRFYFKDELPMVTSPIRRAARLRVDRELTLKILELRLEKTGSSNHAWPKKLEEFASAVCPGETYAYTSGGGKMGIRFEGSVVLPEGTPVLPLEFRSGTDREATATPTPAVTPTPAPEAP